MDDLVCWRDMLTTALAERGETWADVIEHTLSRAELDARFDNTYGCVEGPPFTLWTSRCVYFPTEYDGSEGVASVPRHPTGEKTRHV